MVTPSDSPAHRALAGGGELGRLIRSHDWSATSLGPISGWPQSLVTSLSVVLNAQMPMWLGWGPNIVFFYNDAYIDVLSQAKHPWALGQPAAEVWREIWHVCGPLAAQVFRDGAAPYVEDVRLFMDRGDFLEEVYYSFSYSPVRDDSGQVAGLFCPNTEVTAKLLGARRLGTLSALAARALLEKTTASTCASVAETLRKNPDDIPFAALYLIGADGAPELAQAIQLSPEQARGQRWPIARVLASGAAATIEVHADDALPRGLADQPVRRALVLPIVSSNEARPWGVLVAGVNPTRRLDGEYRAFFDLIAAQTAAALQSAASAEQEKRRADTLAELDRAKTTFFSNISHEFRTPLTLMIGPIEDALGEGTTLGGEALQSVHRNALRQLKLVNALLDFSRLEAGQMTAIREPVDLAQLTQDVASGFRSAIERAGLGFEVDIEALAAPVAVDRDMWEKIVLNLLSNALKFTRAGTIRVALRTEGAAAALTVADTGTGIPADQMPRLFERFQRIDNPQARTQEGSGIGLALVHELARLHGGDVTAHSELGQGTTFTVTLPLEPPVARAPAPPLALRRRTVTGQAHLLEAERWTAGLGDPAPADDDGLGSAAGPDRATILLADDNADMRDYLRRLLSEHWRVVVTGDGLRAVELARAEAPDLVMSDVMMPGLDGFGVLKALRAEPRTRAVPVILLSARAGDEARVEGLAAGADDYIVKPFSARELIARVRTHLTLARLRREHEASAQRLRAALAASAIGTYTRNLHTDEVEHDEGVRRLFGFVDGEGQALAEYTARVHEADRAGWLEALARCGRDSDELTFEYRVVRPDGSVRWILDKGAVSRDGHGAATHVTGAVVDITEQKVLAERALEAGRTKDEFLAMLGHELRNPLAPIVTALDLLKLKGNGETREYATIARQVAHLSRLVDDLLDVSRLTRGLIELKRERVRLGEVVGKALEIARPLIEQRAHVLEIDLAADPLVHGDPARLAQVFSNLLNNAARYTPRGGRLAIGSARRGDRVVVRVTDNGIGIDASMLGRIFDLFVQGGADVARSEGGLGVGLALVQSFVRMHGGEVSAHSAGRGQGAELLVELPIIDEHAERTLAAAAPVRTRNGRRLLLVDDNVDAAELLGELLEALGHEVSIAHDGPSALALLGRFRPEVAVLDVGLPVMDGYELARRVRALVDDCRLIALTGYGQESDRARSAAAGFAVHLVKPVDIDLLIRALAGE